ncbi:3-hydroxyacyl-CoA dehydrogenase type-2-like isoform X2 [Dendroctonus ponderosae]
MQIKNSVFLVVGGASDLYGRATVEKLLKEGGRVIICDLPTKDLHIYGDDKAIFLPINVSSDVDIKTLVSVVDEKYGRLDGVVNCTDQSSSTPVYDFKEKEPQKLQEFADILYENILGPFNIIRFTIPLLARNVPKKGSGRGIIINMSNAAAFESSDKSCAYAASKAAVVRMTEALNFELQGIQVRCVSIVTDALNGSEANSVSSFFDNINGSLEETEGPRKFAELVKTVVETSTMNASMIRLDSVPGT